MGENASPTSSNEPEDSGDRGCEDPEWNGDHEERRVELRCGRVNRTCQSIMLAVCFVNTVVTNGRSRSVQMAQLTAPEVKGGRSPVASQG